jgi:hypothetical protein
VLVIDKGQKGEKGSVNDNGVRPAPMRMVTLIYLHRFVKPGECYVPADHDGLLEFVQSVRVKESDDFV